MNNWIKQTIKLLTIQNRNIGLRVNSYSDIQLRALKLTIR